MAKETSSTKALDATPSEPLSLRTYFQEFKEEAAPPAALLVRIVDDGVTAFAPTPQPFWADWSRWLPGLAVAAMACVAGVLWLQPMFSTQTTISTPPSRRGGAAYMPPQRQPNARKRPLATRRLVPKGEAILNLLHAQKTPRGFTHRQLTRDGARLSAGDLVQLHYQTAQPAYVMVLSLNQKGEVSLFIPFGKSQSIRVATGVGHLPKTGSLELDAYTGREFFFLLSSPKPFAVQEAKKAIEKAFVQTQSKRAQLRELPGPWTARVIAVQKQARR